MKKNNNKVSQHSIKRADAQVRRKNRINYKINSHVKWLEHIVYAGEKLDMDKLWTKTVISKLTGKLEKLNRSPKEVKLIIDKLVSRNVGKTVSVKKEQQIAN